MPKPTKITNGALGNDTLFGDTKGALSGSGQNQTINGLAGDDTLYGDAFSMKSRARGGNDIINETLWRCRRDAPERRGR